jgi:uncharacterized repeat protein (TIGR02543 family)
MAQTDFRFIGWNTRADGTGTTYVESFTFKMPAENVILYAQWISSLYQIAYNANGGTSAPAPQTGIAGLPVTLAPVEPVKPSNTFALWSVVPSGGSTTYSKGGVLTMPSSNLVLYAQWNAIVVAEPTAEPAPVSPGVSVFVITYDSNTATSGQVPIDIKRYVTGEVVTVLTNSGSLARTGFTFAGWNTKADGTGTPLSVDPAAKFTMLPNNIVLYAQWIPVGKYSLTYNGNGSSGGTVPVESENLVEGGKFSVKGNSGSLSLPLYAFSFPLPVPPSPEL